MAQRGVDVLQVARLGCGGDKLHSLMSLICVGTGVQPALGNMAVFFSTYQPKVEWPRLSDASARLCVYQWC